MKIHSDLDQIPKLINPVITIGTFDGLHLGHQKVLTILKSKAQEVSGESVVFTFHPHPRMVLHPNDHDLELIQTIEERVEKFKDNNIDHLIIFPFSKRFSRLSSLEFIRDILVNKLNLHTLIVGYDHHFGRNREGSMTVLKELSPLYDFDIVEITALIKEDTNISSTKIRNALKIGDVKKANKFLGSNFTLSGKVIKGDRIGTGIGFPTANLKLAETYKILPAFGVYAVNVKHNGLAYFGMLNIGTRPTVNLKNEMRIEVNIFDFDKDIYDDFISVELIERLRGENDFGSLEDLKLQLKEDEKNSRFILGNSIL